MKMAGPLTHLPALLPQELWRHASVGTLRVFKDGEAAPRVLLSHDQLRIAEALVDEWPYGMEANRKAVDAVLRTTTSRV
jgi:hypothetical protein